MHLWCECFFMHKCCQVKIKANKPGWGLIWRYVETTACKVVDITNPLLNLTFSPIIAATSVTAFWTVVSPLILGCSRLNFKPWCKSNYSTVTFRKQFHLLYQRARNRNTKSKRLRFSASTLITKGITETVYFTSFTWVSVCDM